MQPALRQRLAAAGLPCIADLCATFEARVDPDATIWIKNHHTCEEARLEWLWLQGSLTYLVTHLICFHLLHISAGPITERPCEGGA